MPNLSVEIDPATGNVRAYCDVRVAEEVHMPQEEITLSAAKKIDPEAQIGDVLRKEIVAKSFGRIAAQTAKQVIIQRIREAEHEIVYNEYKDRVGDIITAIVRRYERGNVVLDLGKVEAIIPHKEQCPREGYGVGRRFKVYIVSVAEGSKGPEIVVSRSHPGLVRKLFELEVPEISDGTVEIKAIARDPGFRTKIAVSSSSEKVDAVGACVGMRGARVKNVVRELNGEKVDIVRWNEDITAFVTNALSPATLKEVKVVDKEAKRVAVVVDDDQFPLAVGRKGQGTRLVSRLTGWRVEVRKRSIVEREEQESKVPVDELPGLTDKVTALLKEKGYKTLGDLRSISVKDLLGIPGIGDKTAEKIIEGARSFHPPSSEEVEGGRKTPDAGPPEGGDGKAQGSDERTDAGQGSEPEGEAPGGEGASKEVNS
jgi:N utilization substance protein A